MNKLTYIPVLKHWLCKTRFEDGHSLVELAIAFPVFIFLVLAVIDFGHLFFVRMDVQNALQEAARYGSMGNHLPDPNNPGSYLSRTTSIIDTLENDAWGVNISSIQLSSWDGVNTNTTSTTSAGGPGYFLTVSATVNMPLMTPLIARIFPNGQYTFTSSITVKNEPFSPSETN